MRDRNFILVFVITWCGWAGITPSAYPGQLLNSWEGGLEEWTASNANFTLANTAGGPNAGVGVTHGTDSLEVTIPTQGFQRWGQRILTGTMALADLANAAATPLTRKLEFDVTYDTSQFPQGSVTFLTEQLAINTNNGWSQVDFSADAVSGSTDTTVHLMAPLSRFETVTPTINAATFFLATNNNWGSGSSGKIFLDNLRLSPIVPDLNDDMVVNVIDWNQFRVNHLTMIEGTSGERFRRGDLDSDGDNDFHDYLIFEASYDEVNGAGAFQEMLLHVPEPTLWTLCCLPLAGMLRRCRGRRRAAMVLCCTVTWTTSANAQLLNSWETGLEGWRTVTFGSVPAAVSTSTIGATDGTQSLAIEQSEGFIFSWDAQVNYGSGSAGFSAFANAVDVGVQNFALEFDVTYDTNSIPQGLVSFLNMSVALNSSGGWIQYDNLAGTAGNSTETVHVSIPLDQAVNLAPSSQTTFYQINFGMNGDWGFDPATFYFDNLRLVQTSVPATLTLEVDRATGDLAIRNDNTGDSFTFNYYTITSAGDSLDRAGWNSLDDQNIDAVDGPDPGFIAGDSPLEGWDELGAAAATDNLTEAFLLGSSTLANNQMFTLGTGYNNRRNAEDLQFRYRDLRRPGRLATGSVIYVNDPPGVNGDFNNDGLWNCSDINALSAAVAAGSTDLVFDMNGDGVISLADVTDPADGWLAVGGVQNPAQPAATRFLTAMPTSVAAWTDPISASGTATSFPIVRPGAAVISMPLAAWTDLISASGMATSSEAPTAPRRSPNRSSCCPG